MSLQGQISVDGEEWTVETPSDQIKDPAHTNRLYPSLTQEFLRKESLGEDLTWSPVLVLVPVRLGSESRLNPLYGTCIQALLADPTCIGIIGGRPKHSLYFVGFQDDNLIHLDPHLVQVN
jgi:cysteine protease ATG4